MLARIATRRLAVSAQRASYPAWKLDYSNFKNGEWVEMELETGGTEKVWIPANTCPETLAEVEFDNTKKRISLHAAGLDSSHYEMIFGLTAVGYVLFTLYDWRSEAKHAEAHGH